MKRIFFLTAFILSALPVNAQEINLDLSFAYGTPKGDFSQVLDRDVYGLEGALTYQVPHSPIHLGIGMTYQNYGWKERYEYFSPAIQEVQVKVRTTNNMFIPHLVARLEPDLGFFSPFVEGTLGLNYMYTQSSVIDEWDEEEIASTINYDYLTTSSGIGGGVKFRIYEGYDHEGDYLKVSMIIKSRFMLGGVADYLREDDLIRSRRGIEYSVNRSRTDLSTFHVGFVLSF